MFFIFGFEGGFIIYGFREQVNFFIVILFMGCGLSWIKYWVLLAVGKFLKVKGRKGLE